jgi:hypothetical protein
MPDVELVPSEEQPKEPKFEGITVRCPKCNSIITMEIKGCQINVLGLIQFMCKKCQFIIDWPDPPWRYEEKANADSTNQQQQTVHDVREDLSAGKDLHPQG